MKKTFTTLFLLLIIKFITSNQLSNLKTHFSSMNISVIQENTELNEHKGVCFVKIDDYFFDLNHLSSPIPYTIKSSDNQLINFNFCENVKSNCEFTEGLVLSKERCKRFAEDNENEKTWKLSYNNKNNSVLTVILPQGDVCRRDKNELVKYDTRFELTCDRNESSIKITNEKEFNPLNCLNVIKMSSKYGNNLLIISLY